MSEQTTTEEPLLKAYLREAVEALKTRESHLRNACRLAERVNHERPHEYEIRLSNTRAALAFWERLQGIEVESEDFSGVSDMGFPKTTYVSFAAGRHQEHVWKRDNEDAWFVGRTPEPEQAALCLLAAALECRRRNEVGA